MTDPDPLALAELLCARLCHDLAGPVGATAAGAELFQDLGGGDPETLAMVSTSASGASARLRLLRAALGPAASSPQSVTSLKSLVDAHLASQASAAAPAILCRWTDFGSELDGGRARLVLNLVLLGRDSLPRGGTLDIRLEQGWPVVVMRGEPAALSDDVRDALLTGVPPQGPKAAQATLTRLVVAGLGGMLRLTPTPQGLRLAVEGASSS